MTVYLLCFERTIAASGSREVRHYVGYARTGHLRERMREHARTTIEYDGDGRWRKVGPGAALVGFANARGIGWHLARTWPDGDRGLERWIKASGQRYRFCPTCYPATRSGLHVDARVRTFFEDDSGARIVRRVVFDRDRIRRPKRFAVAYVEGFRFVYDGRAILAAKEEVAAGG